jgi:hypothetical protein
VGCAFGVSPCMGGSAEFPEMKERRGRGPMMEEVTCVANGLKKISRSKNFVVRGGSCWIFLSLNQWDDGGKRGE